METISRRSTVRDTVALLCGFSVLTLVGCGGGGGGGEGGGGSGTTNNALSCPAGSSEAVNASVCCPDGFPYYYASDDRCHTQPSNGTTGGGSNTSCQGLSADVAFAANTPFQIRYHDGSDGDSVSVSCTTGSTFQGRLGEPGVTQSGRSGRNSVATCRVTCTDEGTIPGCIINLEFQGQIVAGSSSLSLDLGGVGGSDSFSFGSACQ